jgi:phosphatidylserine/phosphatidylglycerophosphate/cardiolipin synthase-like enzyme
MPRTSTILHIEKDILTSPFQAFEYRASTISDPCSRTYRLTITLVSLKMSPEAIEFLSDNGAEVRVVKDRKLHEKTILIDDKTLVVGSHNITKAAAQYNYEASVALRILNDHLVKKIKRHFDEIWKESEPV